MLQLLPVVATGWPLSSVSWCSALDNADVELEMSSTQMLMVIMSPSQCVKTERCKVRTRR